MRNRSLGIICLWLAVFALPAFGDLVVVSGAGPSIQTAADLSLIPLTEIQGNFGMNSNDPAVNIFKIDIQQPGEFSARTIDAGAFGVPDTELFLFNSSGFGVAFNDDIGPGTLSCLPSSDSLTSPCAPVAGVGPTLQGIYYLAITYSANDPLDANGSPIFTNILPTDVVGPNAGAGPLAGWDGNIFTQPDSDLTGYDINISGAEPSPLPEPSSFLPLILILASLVAYWRRLHSST